MSGENVKTGNREDVATGSLACADEVFMRCAPGLMRNAEIRRLAAEVIDRDKTELRLLLEMIADGIDSQSEININTGMIACFVDPDFFPRFKTAMARHADREVLRGIIPDGGHRRAATAKKGKAA